MADNDVRAYESDVSIGPIGHEPTQSHLQEAQDKFLAEATEANPNGVQGDPELIGTTFVVGGDVTYRFRIGLVDNPSEVPNGQRERNRAAKPSSDQQPS